MYSGPGRYKHYKGGVYRVLGVARQKESGERFVIYESLEISGSSLGQDDFWARPISNFNENVGSVPRFEKVDY